MQDPFERATSSPPAMLGEGCISRYDPDALSADNGSEFADAAALWQQLQMVQTQAGNLEPALRPTPNLALEPKR